MGREWKCYLQERRNRAYGYLCWRRFSSVGDAKGNWDSRGGVLKGLDLLLNCKSERLSTVLHNNGKLYEAQASAPGGLGGFTSQVSGVIRYLTRINGSRKGMIINNIVRL